MIARSLTILSLGVALSFAAPISSTFAQDAKKPQTEQVLKKKKPAVKKTESKKTDKKVAKKSGKKAKPEPEVPEKPKGLFASIFGPPKTDDKAAAKETKDTKAKKTAVASAESKKPVAKARAEVASKTKEGEQQVKPFGLWLFGNSPASERKESAQPQLARLEPIAPVEQSATSSEIVRAGNNGELRSDNPAAGGGMMASMFGGEDVYLPETRALDSAYRNREQSKKKPFQVAEKWQPQIVEFSGYPRGTIVIDTANHFLYLVEGMGKARRYGIAVGKDGLQYKGDVKVGDKQEWPRWIPTKEMQERDPKAYGKFKDGMPGGGMNPLGARAIYLYEGRKDTHLRIHGTIAPQTIGTNSSNGCFRMVNEHVIDLYRRVPVGTNVVVL